MKKNNGLPQLTEEAEQISLIQWTYMQSGKYPELRLLYHCPNGGSRHRPEAVRFQAMGVKPGVPDLFLPVARRGLHGLYIEMKREDGGRVSNYQRQWLEDLTREGYGAVVCSGFEEAKKTLLWYLGENDNGH